MCRALMRIFLFHLIFMVIVFSGAYTLVKRVVPEECQFDPRIGLPPLEPSNETLANTVNGVFIASESNYFPRTADGQIIATPNNCFWQVEGWKLYVATKQDVAESTERGKKFLEAAQRNHDKAYKKWLAQESTQEQIRAAEEEKARQEEARSAKTVKLPGEKVEL